MQRKGKTMMGIGAIMLMAIATVGCSDHPQTRAVKSDTTAGVRTGKVQNIGIMDSVNPDSLSVRAGDEVRWLNQRQHAVRVTFSEPLDGKVSCQGGFTKWLSSGMESDVTLKANETASLCFNRLGTVKYRVTTDDKDDPRPIKDLRGNVIVE